MSKVLCIYHGNCADGFGAAWAVRHGLGAENVEFHAGVYQQPPPDVTGRKVVLVDFSYRRPVLEEMAKTAQSILILDHHKSAAEDLAGFPAPPTLEEMVHPEHGQLRGWLPLEGIYARFDMNRSGAMLAWEHFNLESPPALLLHIEDRDLWRFKLDGTKQIQAALFSHVYDFSLWDELMKEPVATLYREGLAIDRKHMKDIEEFLKVGKRRMFIGGHNVPVCSLPYFYVSEAGHIMAQGEPFAACYWDTPDGRIFGLRSADGGVDVSAIAKRYGGGGHKNAAGFKIQYCQADHHVAKPIKVFEYHVDGEEGPLYFAGPDIEDIDQYVESWGSPQVRALTEAELDGTFLVRHREDGGESISFRAHLMDMISKGVQFPNHFAEPIPK